MGKGILACFNHRVILYITRVITAYSCLREPWSQNCDIGSAFCACQRLFCLHKSFEGKISFLLSTCTSTLSEFSIEQFVYCSYDSMTTVKPDRFVQYSTKNEQVLNIVFVKKDEYFVSYNINNNNNNNPY